MIDDVALGAESFSQVIEVLSIFDKNLSHVVIVLYLVLAKCVNLKTTSIVFKESRPVNLGSVAVKLLLLFRTESLLNLNGFLVQEFPISLLKILHPFSSIEEHVLKFHHFLCICL